ncbi:MAG: 3-oxoacid CoA-transferase subunit A [Pseudothermotoga sp.]|uniref:CoA transferase subunit A n=1 Tax=Pseudothermotoga sp. TaxID=2033661 RepID=UPI0025902A5D|nr:3-oxoacid CoA-transferase subunit A [Pseudothermotoga sp.]MDI6862279.1 3-oxoacid CoA-transferase subunit A [Pseudothermotoga sp.]
MKNKLISVEQAIEMIPDGAVLMIGGFLGDGTPELLVDGLIKAGKKNLTVIANDTAFPDRGIGKLIVNKLVKKVIVSHIGTNPETQKQMIEGTLEVELVPQGTLAERVRAGGFGLGGILTPTGVGTVVENGKQKITIDGKEFLVETALKADFALIKAKKADFLGNLVFNYTARNFNPLMAFAGNVTIVEVEELVPVGGIDPNEVQVPHAVVDYIVRGNAK